MSFLTRTTPSLLLLRSSAAATTRPFSAAAIYRKTNTETVAEPLKKVDRVVSDQLVKGIDAAVSAKDQAAAAAGVQTSKAQGKAAEVAGQAKGTAAEVKGQAKGTAAEVKGRMA